MRANLPSLAAPAGGAVCGILALYLAGGGQAAVTPAGIAGVAAAALVTFLACRVLTRSSAQDPAEPEPAPEPEPVAVGGGAGPLPAPHIPAAPSSAPDWFLEGLEEDSPGALLERCNIVLGCPSVTAEEAIRACGRMLVEAGYVDEPYIQGMLDREREFPLAIGCHVAIPHAVNAARRYIRRSGIVVMTYPDGIPWDGDTVKLVIGIAAQADAHLDILGRIVSAVPTEEDTDRLVSSADPDVIYRRLNSLD